MKKIRTLFLGGVCVLVIAACSGEHDDKSKDSMRGKRTNTQVQPMPQGVDVSHFQGQVDWQAVAATKEISFAFIKASQGLNTVDPQYQSNWSASSKTGLLRGVYHYLDPSLNGTQQAQHFVQVVQGQLGDFPPVIDIEAFEGKPASEVISVLSDYIAIVKKKYNCKPIIYTSPGFWDQLSDHEFGGYPLWLADYAQTPTLPNGWSSWLFWQFESDGKVSGIQGYVDRDKFNGTLKQLQQLKCKQ